MAPSVTGVLQGVLDMYRREREITEHIPTRAHPGSQEATPPPAGGIIGISRSKCKAKLVAVVGAVCS